MITRPLLLESHTAPVEEKTPIEQLRRARELSIIPRQWRCREDVPSLETICEHIKSDALFSDRFFFAESYNWQNYYEGTYEPLYDFQGLIIKTCEDNQVVWLQASRGSSKSSTVARWMVSYCLRNPHQAVKIVSASFRQSKQMFDYCTQIIKTNSGIESLLYKLEQDIPETSIKRGHEVIMEFNNGSTIEALPCGTGESLRGKRATVLVLDEFYLFPRELYVSHIVPFLNVKKGDKAAKLIHLTTSYYSDVFAHSVLDDIANYVKQSRPGYAILDITIDDVIASKRPLEIDEPSYTPRHFPAELPIILHQLETGTDKITGQLSDEMRMTFYNSWIKSSANWYRTDKIIACQLAEVEVLAREPKDNKLPFVLGVDLAGMGNDSTAMAVLSLPGGDIRELRALYKWNRIHPDEIAGHIHQMCDLFPSIKTIVMDKTGTLGKQVASICEKPLQLIDGTYQTRIPIMVWDHPDRSLSRARLILTLPSDDLMESGLFGARVDSKIGGEIELKNALHLDMKARFENYDFRAPLAVADEEYFSGEKTTRGELLDNIREALAQFPKLTRKKDREGKPLTDPKGNFYFNRPPKDDSAYAVIYANWASNIVIKGSVRKHRTVDPPIYWEPQQLQDTENHQVVRAKFY